MDNLRERHNVIARTMESSTNQNERKKTSLGSLELVSGHSISLDRLNIVVCFDATNDTALLCRDVVRRS